MARYSEFDYDRSELADMENSECKANCILKHDLPEWAEAMYLPCGFFYSQRQKEENLKDVNGESVSK